MPGEPLPDRMARRTQTCCGFEGRDGRSNKIEGLRITASKAFAKHMALIVHKYGGTSMGSTERIRNVAKRVAKWARAGHQMVVVPVGHERRETNRLLGLAKSWRPRQHAAAMRELDMIASTGEQVSVGLLASRCRPKGMEAVSYSGWQVPIATDSPTPRPASRASTTSACAPIWPPARWSSSPASRAWTQQEHHHAGPWRQRHLGRGRGGAMKADECLIYTDVDGVYTTDPRVVPRRAAWPPSAEEMLEMASPGLQVLQIRSSSSPAKVPRAAARAVQLHALGHRHQRRGQVRHADHFEEDEKMEQAVVSGIAFNRDEAKITLLGVPDKPGIAYQILGAVADANIDVDVIIQNVSTTARPTSLHRPPQRLRPRSTCCRTRSAPPPGARTGAGRHQDLQGLHRRHRHAQPRRRGQQDVPRAERRGINIQMISTSEIKTSVVNRREVHGAGRARLHKAFDLDAPATV